MDKILITGCAGFIGSNLANHLLKNENNYIYGMDDFSNSTMSNLYPLLRNERFEFIEHNLLSQINLCADYVFHLAGCGDLKSYHDNKYDFILNKIEIIKNIISYSQKQGAKLIIASDYQDRQEKNKTYYQYYDCVNLIENLIFELIDTAKLNATIVRLESVYGENLSKDDTRFIPQTIIKAFSNADFCFDNDESCYFTYMGDVVLNLEKIITKFYNKPILDLINTSLYLKSDIAKLIIKCAKSNSKVELKSAIQAHPTFSPITVPDFECQTPILNGINATVNNFKLMHYS